MSKQNIHIKVDSSIYLALKAKNLNVSGTVNELLKNYVNQEEIETEETIILDEISNIKKQINQLNDRLSTEVVKLQVVQERDRAAEKEDDKKRKMFVNTMRFNNPLKREMMKDD